MELKRTTNTIKSVKLERLLNTKWSISIVRLYISEHIMQNQFPAAKVIILSIDSVYLKATVEVLGLRVNSILLNLNPLLNLLIKSKLFISLIESI